MKMWLFGYGSLIWKVDFPYKNKQVGRIKGYVRRFYQHSIDHRGTQENPGRVVTLLPSDSNSEVWGVAYEISDTDDSVWQQLDFREKNGYQRRILTFFPKDGGHPFEVIVYISGVDNEWYAGEATIGELAKCIVPCKGQSGENVEYLYRLAESMRQIAPHAVDNHLFELESEVAHLLAQKCD